MDADSFPLSAGRRALLKGGTLILASAALGSKPIAANEQPPASGNVLAVFQGHSHRNDVKQSDDASLYREAVDRLSG